MLYRGSRIDHSFRQFSRVTIRGEVKTGEDERRSRLSMLDSGVEKGILVFTPRMVSSLWV